MKRKILILTNNARMMLVFRREMLSALRRTYDIVLACPKDPSAEKDFTDLGIRTLNVPVDRRGMNPVKDALLFVLTFAFCVKKSPVPSSPSQSSPIFTVLWPLPCCISPALRRSRGWEAPGADGRRLSCDAFMPQALRKRDWFLF